jgi:hypothetical protein
MVMKYLLFFFVFAISTFASKSSSSENLKPAENYIVLESTMNIKFPDSSQIKLPFSPEGIVRYFKITGNNLLAVIDTLAKDSLITRSYIFIDLKTKKLNISTQKILKQGTNYFISLKANIEEKIYLRKKYSSLSLTEMITKFILEKKVTSFDYYYGNIVYSTLNGSIIYYNLFERTIRKLLNNNAKNEKKTGMANFSPHGDKIIYISHDSLKTDNPQSIICIYNIRTKNVFSKIRIPYASQAKLSADSNKLIVLVAPENKIQTRNKTIIRLPLYNKIIIYDIDKKKTEKDIYEINACWYK